MWAGRLREVREGHGALSAASEDQADVMPLWFNAVLLAIGLLLHVHKRWRERRRELPPAERPTLDLDDPLIREALRELDALAPNMPVAPPRDERDWTEEERVAAAGARSRLLSVLVEKRRADQRREYEVTITREQMRVRQQREEDLKRTHSFESWVAARWRQSATWDASGSCTLPNLTVVTREEIDLFGWEEVVKDILQHDQDACRRAFLAWNQWRVYHG